jgi:hypothetical protein
MILGKHIPRILLLLSPPTTFSFLFSRSKTLSCAMSASANNEKEYRRSSDGIKIDYDPYAPGMSAKYGLPGGTDPDGFDVSWILVMVAVQPHQDL